MKFLPPLRSSVPITVLLVAILLGTLSVYSEWTDQITRIEQDALERLSRTGNLLAGMAQFHAGQKDADGMRLQVSLVGTIPFLDLALVVDERDQVMASTRFEYRGKNAMDLVNEQFKPLILGARSRSGAQFGFSEDHRTVAGAFSFLLPSQPGQLHSTQTGVCYLQLSLGETKLRARQAVIRRSLQVLAVLAALCGLVWLALHAVITKRVHKLLERTTILAQGRADPGPTLSGNDELAQLSRAFETMANSLHARNEQLREANNQLQIEVAERLSAQQQLLATESRYRGAIAAADAVPYQVDYKTDSFVFLGEGILRLTGYSAAEMTPKLLSLLVQESIMRGPAIGLPEGEAIRRTRMGDFAQWKNDSRILTRNGEIRWIADTSVELLDAQNSPVGSIGILQDITERKTHEQAAVVLERKLQEAQKLESLGVLAGGIAHDFNNLLTAILGNAGLAAQQLVESSECQSYLLNIEKTSLQAADLCQQMLAYSGRGKFTVQHLTLDQVVRDMSQLLRVSIAKSVSLHVEPTGREDFIEADPSQIRQIILNLVINASESIAPGQGNIHIRTGGLHASKEYLVGAHLSPELPEGDYAFLEIEDDGTGMSEETMARIFDPFFTTKFTGRGLGLAAVLGIVRGHRGALKLSSEIAKGTTFRILFPISRTAPVARSATGYGDSEWMGSGTILIVDDEPAVRFVTAEIVESLGFKAITAEDGLEGLETYRRNPNAITLVILDLTMPRMDGEQTLAGILETNPGAKVLLMSGFSEIEVGSRFKGKGLAGFLHKPFGPVEVRQKLQALLGTGNEIRN